MKIRSLKQALHWLFLIVGTVSVLLLVFSVLAYVDYAREGYGMEATVTEAWVNAEGKLVLRLSVENPGGMDLILGPFAHLTMSDTYTINTFGIPVKADRVTEVILSFPLGDGDIAAIQDGGMASFTLDIDITVKERDAVTNLRLVAKDLEVSP